MPARGLKYKRLCWGAGVLAVSIAGCGTDGPPKDADLVAGKQQFVARCGSCHQLARANTTGKQGPNLDEAFRESLSEGFGRSSVRGVVRGQIRHPANVPQSSPAYMPAQLATGKRAEDIAAYVASVVALGGKDTGRLATAVKPAGAGKPVAASGGRLLLPADPNGQLTYITKKATANAGRLQIISKNDSSIPHDIALEGNGVHAAGTVVKDGGTSQIRVTLKPGSYQFFCTVPGHRAGGMEGTLTVT